MVNGTLSRILYLGAIILILACIVGIIAHGLTDRPVPYELTGVLSSCLAFLFGAHVRPPISAGGRDESE